MKFDALNGKTEFEAQVSDHYIVVEGVYATFNVLGQCQKFEKYYNNGFKIVETDAEYADRLFNKTIPVIQELYSQGVRVFMLQEAPALIHLHGDNPTLAEERHYAIADEFYTRLQEALPQLEIKDAPYSKNWGRTDSAGLLTIVDKQWSDKLIDTTMDMKSHVSENNQERFQSFDLYLNGKTDPIKIANFHADFFTQEDTKADVKYFVSEHYVVGGDFNLIELPELGVNVVSDKTEPGLMLTDTYDAIFFGDPDAQYVSPLLDAFIGITEVLIEDAHWVFNDIIIDTQMMSAPIQHGYLDHFDQAAILV